MTHGEPTLAEYGYTPGPGESAWWRAFEARNRAEVRRTGEARHLADAMIATPGFPDLDVATRFYRMAAAHQDYADAVYQVECDRRGFPGEIEAAS